ncbi:MAG: hypothetical protein IRZ16_12435 [Myxococcaceae bacterium]|nr:hypothetical protein [Myxococcaceae bacterium]
MNAKILGAFLLALTGSGCIIVGGGGNPPPPLHPGDVTFTWTFAGQNCPDVPYVKNIHLQIPGETLQNDGYFPCLADNYPGINLLDFAGGSYSFTIDAIDYSNNVVFSSSGRFTVDGDLTVNVDLAPVGDPLSYAYVRWFFPPLNPPLVSSTIANPSCADAWVATVDMYVDDQLVDHFPCAQGQTADGVPTPYLTGGNHTIMLVAYDATGNELYRKAANLPLLSGKAIGVDYTLDWSVGGVAIGWQLSDGIQQSCAQAHVTTVYVNFRDSAGNLLYPGAGDPQNCNAPPALYNYLYPDTYEVYLQAPTNDGSGDVYLSSASSPLVVTIFPGQFMMPNNAPTVVLTRQ